MKRGAVKIFGLSMRVMEGAVVINTTYLPAPQMSLLLSKVAGVTVETRRVTCKPKDSETLEATAKAVETILERDAPEYDLKVMLVPDDEALAKRVHEVVSPLQIADEVIKSFMSPELCAAFICELLRDATGRPLRSRIEGESIRIWVD